MWRPHFSHISEIKFFFRLPRFAHQLNRPCHAISLRGTSGSPAEPGTKSVHIWEHVEDVKAFVEGPLAQEAAQASLTR